MTRTGLKSFLPWVVADSAVSLASAILLALVVARLIGPVEFGIGGTAILLGSIAETLVALPFSEALIQRRKLDTRISDAAFVGMAITGTLAFLALCALAVPIARAFGVPGLAALIVAQATTCLFLAARGVPEALLARKLRFKALAIRNIAAKFLSAVAALACVALGGGAWSIVLANIVFAATSTAMVLAMVARRPRFRPDAPAVWSLLRFGVFSLLDGLLWTATSRLFALMVGHSQGIRALGYLSVGFRINDAIGALLAAVTARIALPIFARTAEHPGQLAYAFRQGSKLTAMISAPIFVGLAMVSHEAIMIFLGPDWTPAATALIAVSLLSLTNFARLLAPPAIKAVGRPALLVWQHVIGLVYVAGATALVAHRGFDAQLLVWTSFGIVYFVVSVALMYRATGISWQDQLAPLVRPALATAGMALALWAADRALDGFSATGALAVKIAVGVVAYGVLLALLERRFLSRIIGIKIPAE